MSFAAIDEFSRHFAESRLAVASLLVSIAFLLCAIFAPAIAPTNPYDLSQLDLADALKPAGSPKVVPGEELRVQVKIANAAATFADLPAGMAIRAITAQSCGEKCLDIGVEPANIALESLQIRGLPPGLTVEGANKHPVQPWWTVAAPADGKARIVAEGRIPSDFSFLIIVKSAPQATGYVFQLGTDSFGRDMLSAILYGIRISVIVGLAAAGSALVLGISLGLLAAWMGGTIDAIIMRAVDFMLGFPALLVGLAVLAILGNGVDKVVFAIIIVQWSYYARATRSVAMAELSKEYVEAAKTLRLSPVRIMLRHVLPNCLPQVIVLFTLNIASAISLESSLSFLGVGLPLTQPSLGMLIANGYEFIFSQKYWISLYPGIVLLVMIVAVNLLGDRLRDVNNPRLAR